MDNFEHARPIAELIERKAVTDADVLRLRREVYRNGVVNREEARDIFALDHLVTDKPESWREFFVEAIVDYVVEQEAPRGYISNANAEWLVDAISHDGVVDYRTEFELLIKVIERAHHVPAHLAAFALDQVAIAVIEGKGSVARGRTLTPGVIGEHEVEILRRILYASGGHGNVAITREEAEVLFHINDSTREADNHLSWTELFTKAVACSLMAASGYTPPNRDEALRREEWLGDTSVNLGRFFSKMFAGSLDAHIEAVKLETGSESYWGERNARMDTASGSSEKIDAPEAEWLVERIGRDGVLHENEKELLGFLKRESPHIHPALRPLLEKVA